MRKTILMATVAFGLAAAPVLGFEALQNVRLAEGEFHGVTVADSEQYRTNLAEGEFNPVTVADSEQYRTNLAEGEFHRSTFAEAEQVRNNLA